MGENRERDFPKESTKEDKKEKDGK